MHQRPKPSPATVKFLATAVQYPTEWWTSKIWANACGLSLRATQTVLHSLENQLIIEWKVQNGVRLYHFNYFSFKDNSDLVWLLEEKRYEQRHKPANVVSVHP